jgi:hypothetical protein
MVFLWAQKPRICICRCHENEGFVRVLTKNTLKSVNAYGVPVPYLDRLGGSENANMLISISGATG